MPSKDLEFHTETGRLSLNWIATLGDRRGIPIERVSTVGDLRHWLIEVAGRNITFELGENDLVEAKHLRDCIIGLIDALTAEKVPNTKHIEAINEFASAPMSELQLDQTGTQLERYDPPNVSELFGEIARDAINLVTSRDFAKVKSCAAEDCSVYFVDYSRPGKRRWCSMARCGNQAKKRTFLSKGG